MARGVIYKYTFPSGKVYIGQTRRPIEIRQREHIDPKIGPLNTGFWEEYEKYYSYDFDVLEAIEHPDMDVLVGTLNRLETDYIKQYQATNPQFGCNKMAYGMEKTDTCAVLKNAAKAVYSEIRQRSMQLWDSIKSKFLDSHEAYTIEEKEILLALKYEDCFQGVSNLFETIEDKHPTYMLSKDQDSDFQEFMIDQQFEALENAIETDCKIFAEEFIQQYASEIIDAHREKYAILQLDAEEKVVKEFYSLQDIAEAFGVKRPDNVRNVLWGKQKTAYGYNWKYKHPENYN